MLLRFLPFMKDERAGYSGVLRFALQILIIGLIVMSVLLIVGHDLILSQFQTKSPLLIEYSFWILPVGIAGAFYILFEHYLRGISKNLISIFFQDFLLRLIVLGIILGYWMEFMVFETFIFLFFAAHVIPALSLVVYLLITKRFYIQQRYYHIKTRLKKMMFSYGLFVYFNSFGRNIILMADATMLAAMSGLEDVGVFTVMGFLANALFVPYVSLIRISAPIIPKYWKERKLDQMKSLYQRVSVIGYFMTFFMFSIVWLNIDFLLSYLPDIYANSKYVFLFLMLGRLFDSIGGVNGDILITSRKYKLDAFITIPLIVITTVLNFVLIPEYGATGAAVATSLVYLLYNVIRLIMVFALFGLHPFTMALFKVALIGIGMLVTGILLSDISGSGLGLVLMTAIPVLLYAVPIISLQLIPEINEFILQVYQKIARR